MGLSGFDVGKKIPPTLRARRVRSSNKPSIYCIVLRLKGFGLSSFFFLKHSALSANPRGVIIPSDGGFTPSEGGFTPPPSSFTPLPSACHILMTYAFAYTRMDLHIFLRLRD